jgi:two-component system NtrC family sensor kinase
LEPRDLGSGSRGSPNVEVPEFESAGAVRVAVVAPPGPGIEQTLRALRQLGPEVTFELHHTTAPVFARLDDADLDLLILDDALGAPLMDLLEARGSEGPPALVVSAKPDEPLALEAFRRGASDCVTRGPGFGRLLAVASLEQIRRHRTARERGAALRQIQWLERLHEAVVAEIPAAVAVADPEGRIVTINAEFVRLLGIGAEGIEGRPLADLLPVPLPERGQLIEARIRRPAGEAAPVGISSAPLVDGEGVPRGRVAILQDLTEVKQLQRQVTQSEKLASIGQLAAGVAHEINNPMGFIHANLFQLGEYLDELSRVWERIGPLRKAVAAGELDTARALGAELDALVREVDADFLVDDASKAVRESLEGSERIRHIVKDLRAFAHQGHGRLVEADLNQCLDSTAHIVWTMMKHSVVLTKDYRELPPVRCIPMQLKQVFMNLLVNAYQAIEEREDSGRGQIRLRTRPGPEGVEIEVEDNGAGVPPDQLDRIFEPFFTTKEVGDGTGLGLSTSYSIVRRHGGTLEVESEPRVRTVFRIRLPLEAPPGGIET